MHTQDIIAYYEGGQHYHDVSKILLQAKKTMDKYTQVTIKDKYAVVLDIDETSINNYLHLKKAGFPQTENDKVWDELLQKTCADPIAPTLEFYRYCLSKNIKIFFISARYAYGLNATKQSLVSAGYDIFEEVYVLPVNITEYTSVYFAEFKSMIRSKIQSQGYNIIASIGDQKSDLSGGFTKHTFLLPNFLYG